MGYGRDREEKKEKKPKRTTYVCDSCGFASDFRGHFEVHEKRHRRSDTGVVIETMVLTCKSTPPYGPRCKDDLLARNEKVFQRPAPVPGVSSGEPARNPRPFKGKPTIKSSPSRE